MENFVETRDRPAGAAVMFQKWRHLLFLHWEVDAAEIQARLPHGLEVDVFEGKAYVGVIPFFMQDVRPAMCPPVYWLSDFLELNVRTYVRDREGRAGVWFFSLDCSQPVAVAVARSFFKLPYFRARMRAQVGPKSRLVYYDCRRKGERGRAHYEYRASGAAARARSGSLDEFLVERYRLFAYRNRRLFAGSVWHDPYEIAPAETVQWSARPMDLAGFDVGGLPPDHAVVSSGVDVEIFPLDLIG
ncbi:MAG: DUF2071 domain-containing protein [Chthoniobacterales bacterium]